MVPQVLAFIQLMYDPSERAKPMAAFSALLGIAAAAGPILGGVLIALDLFGTGWRGVFLVNVPIGVVVAGLALRALPPARADGHVRLDPAGLALSAASLFLMMWGLAGLADTQTPLVQVAVISLGLVLFLVFLVQQRASDRRGGQPLVPLALQQAQYLPVRRGGPDLVLHPRHGLLPSSSPTTSRPTWTTPPCSRGSSCCPGRCSPGSAPGSGPRCCCRGWAAG